MRSIETIVHLVRNDSIETKALTEFFVSRGVSVVAFKTAAEYVATARHDGPTCLILDLILPDADGLELQSRLAESGAPPVIFLTAQGDPVSVVCAMKNGAIDFLLGTVDYGRLMSAVEVAFAEDLRNHNERIELTSLLTRWQSLTPRETEVFRHTVAGLLNKQAAAELGIAENTYQVHRGRVMRKMKADSLADLVRMSTKLEPILPKRCQSQSAMRQPTWSLGCPAQAKVHNGAGDYIPLRGSAYLALWGRDQRGSTRLYQDSPDHLPASRGDGGHIQQRSNSYGPALGG
jgi:FixJ family two-component response regulator